MYMVGMEGFGKYTTTIVAIYVTWYTVKTSTICDGME
jgi:hypothetical protein